MITKYLHIPKAGVRITYHFADTGSFQGILLPEEGLTDNQVEYILKNLPRDLDKLNALAGIVKGSVVEPDIDTSFIAFWNTYAYKVGNKKRAERLWNSLNNDERRAAILAIIKYDRYLSSRPKMEKAFPETFLAQQRWDNDFRS